MAKKPISRRAAPAKPRARKPRQIVQVRGLTDWGTVVGHDFRGVTAETAVRVTSILAVVRWIAQSCASMPWHITYDPSMLGEAVRPGARPPAAGRIEAAAYTLAKRPNSWQSGYDFWQLIAYWVALHGSAYARVIPSETHWMGELRPVHPKRVKAFHGTDGRPFYEITDPETQRKERLDSSQLLHWRWLSEDGLDGLPPIDLCGTSIGLARRLDMAATAYWDNSGRPDMYLETTDRLSDQAMAQLRESIHSAHGGPRNRGKTMVLPPKIKPHTLEQNTMEQAQFQELRDAILSDVCRCWGVPSTILGDHRMAKYSTVEQEHISAQVWGLLPWQRRLEGPVEMMLSDVYGPGVSAKLDQRGLLRADTASRVALYQSLWTMGAITPNEIRAYEDLPALDSPAADQTYVQLGFSTLDNAAAQAAQDGGQQDGGA